MKKILFFLFLVNSLAWAETLVTPEVIIEFIGTKKTSSFPRLIFIQIANPGYTPMDLPTLLKKSSLVVDDKAHPFSASYKGPVMGIPPMGQWDGCLPVDAYGASLPAGKHKISLRVGGTLSEARPIRWEPPVDWRQGNVKSRLKEIQALGEALVDGLPRACVEEWLTVKDGGLQEADKVRYFLEPDYKMVVPYRQKYETRGYSSVVDGPPKVYQEAFFAD